MIPSGMTAVFTTLGLTRIIFHLLRQKNLAATKSLAG